MEVDEPVLDMFTRSSCFTLRSGNWKRCCAWFLRSILLLSITHGCTSVHRFSHGTMPWVNIFRKYVFTTLPCPCFPNFTSLLNPVRPTTIFLEVGTRTLGRQSDWTFWNLQGYCWQETFTDPSFRPPRRILSTLSGITNGSSGSVLESGLYVYLSIWIGRSFYRHNWKLKKLIFSHFFQFAEISNLHTHLTVRALRPPGTRTRGIPQGYGFNLVSFPNYFFETVGWVVISAMTGSVGGSFLLLDLLYLFDCDTTFFFGSVDLYYRRWCYYGHVVD